MKIIGGLDVGTTGCKIALFDEKGTNLNNYYCEYEVLHQNGLHEINFNDVKHGVLSLLKSAANQYKIDALGVTSFGETFCMLDKNDNILAPSMLYTDTRGEDECKYLSEKLGIDYLSQLTGVKPHCMYSISKIMWQKINNPDIFAKTKRILLGEDFIIYTLTGNAQIDYSLAARTAAFDIDKCCWSDKILKAADIDVNLLSKPVPSGTVAGTISSDIKNELGIDYDITIVNGCHDQVAAMIGAGIKTGKQAMDGTGTVECIPVILDKKPDNSKFYDYGFSLVPYYYGGYACYALSFTGGATLKWFRDNFAESEYETAKADGKNIYALLDSKIKSEPTGILILPHFSGAATPYMDNDAKAAIVGLTLETTKYDIYKALMEGTSYEISLNFNTLKEFTKEITELRATGGGAYSDIWLQIKSDILNIEIKALDCKEIGAAGTAALAAKAINATDNIDDFIITAASVRKTFSPNKENASKYSHLYNRYKKIYNSVKEMR